MKFIETYKNVIQGLLVTAAFVAALGSAATWAFTTWSEFSTLPEDVQELSREVQSLNAAVRSTQEDFDVIDLLPGSLHVLTREVEPGGTIWVGMYVRANTDCDRSIRVRFFSDDTRALHWESEVTPAVRSAVSDDYQLLVIPIRTFESMSPGTYRYAPEVVPHNCGVYTNQTLGISDSFRVI